MGDRTELLVEYCLHSLAFSSRVPRQEDVGHDFVCALAEPRGDLLWAGAAFSVQAKSDTSSLVFAKEHELQWLILQENPFFVAVGNKKELRVDLYSTWQRARAFLQNGSRKTTLEFAPPLVVGRDVEVTKDRTGQVIYLGKPILSVTLQQLLDLDQLANARKVLRAWIDVDRRNIVSSGVGIHWTVGPATYETNVSPSLDEVQIGLFWNSQNLGKCVENFVRSAALLRLTLEASRAPGAPRPDPVKIQTLESVMRAWSEALDPGSKGSLKEHCSLVL